MPGSYLRAMPVPWPTPGPGLADAACGTGASAPAALEGAFEHASTWSMSRLAERYVGIYETALSLRQPAR